MRIFTLTYSLALYFLVGCVHYPVQSYELRWSCDELTVPEGLDCPTDAMRIDEALMVNAFEREFFQLSEEERYCVSRYWFQQYLTREEIFDACWDGAWACALYREGGTSTIKVYYNVRDGEFNTVARRHESLHIILWCAGEEGSGDHSHPAFQGHLPEDLSGQRLHDYYDQQDAGAAL